MKQIIEKLRNGDALSDKELENAITHYQTLSNLLYFHGERYALVRADVEKHLRNCQTWKENRARK